MRPAFIVGGGFRVVSAMVMVAVLVLQKYGQQTISSMYLLILQYGTYLYNLRAGKGIYERGFYSC